MTSASQENCYAMDANLTPVASSVGACSPSPVSESLSPEKPLGFLVLRVETSFDALNGFRSKWDETVSQLGGTIYMTYDWCRTWWEFYGTNSELRLLIFHLEGDVVGIIPLYIARLGYWPLQLRVARLVGANIPPKVFNPPVAKEHAEAILKLTLAHMLTKESCDIVSLGPISELYGQHLIHAAGNTRLLDFKIGLKRCGVHSLFELPATFEEYFQGLTKKERKNNRNRYDLSLLHQEQGASEEWVSDASKVADEFEVLADLHTREWQQKQGSGHFLSWPKGREFNRAAICLQAESCRAEFLKIHVNGQAIASIYGFYVGSTYHAELMGRQLEPQWEKYNLGRAILVRALARAIQKGCKVMDAGLGHYDYKDRLNAKEHTVFQIQCRKTSWSSQLKLLIFEGIRILLLVGYHKIWYRRIRKILPARLRRPQAMMWLRFDY